MNDNKSSNFMYTVHSMEIVIQLNWMINLNFLNGRILNISPSYQKPNYLRKQSFSQISRKREGGRQRESEMWPISKESLHDIEMLLIRCCINKIVALIVSWPFQCDCLLFFFLLLLYFILNWCHARWIVRGALRDFRLRQKFEWRILIRVNRDNDNLIFWICYAIAFWRTTHRRITTTTIKKSARRNENSITNSIRIFFFWLQIGISPLVLRN